MLLRPANFLVLDEPTNHLDLAACEVLEGALAGYTGTLLFVSHDRDFIDALATRVVDVRAGTLTSYPGNYTDYQRAHGRTAPLASEAAPASGTPSAPDAKRERMEARARAKDLARRLERARKRVAAIEEEILGHEEQLASLTHQLAQPDIYSDGDLIRAVEADRGEVRAAIERLYADWEVAAAEIEALERDQTAENGGK
jgi:ATP-binding cassette subfamily F protein 3